MKSAAAAARAPVPCAPAPALYVHSSAFIVARQRHADLATAIEQLERLLMHSAAALRPLTLDLLVHGDAATVVPDCQLLRRLTALAQTLGGGSTPPRAQPAAPPGAPPACVVAMLENILTDILACRARVTGTEAPRLFAETRHLMPLPVRAPLAPKREVTTRSDAAVQTDPDPKGKRFASAHTPEEASPAKKPCHA